MYTRKLEQVAGDRWREEARSPMAEALPSLGSTHGLDEVIEDVDEVRALLESFALQAVEAQVRVRGGLTRARLVPAGDGQWRWEGLVADEVTVAEAEFHGPHAVYSVPLATRPGAHELPSWVRRTIRRKHRRSESCSGVRLRIEGPVDSDCGEYVVRDLSRDGLSFEAPASAPLWAGLTCPLAWLVAAPREAHVELCIQNVRPTRDGRTLIVGATFYPMSTSDSAAARQIVAKSLYPTTRFADGEVWALHEASGYLELSGKTPLDFEHLRSGHIDFLNKADGDTSVAVNLSWPAAGAPLATVSNFKPYSSTWLFCHVSKRREVSPEQGRAGLRDLYLRAYETAQVDADTRWLMTYVQDTAPTWSRMVHVGVPQRYLRTGEGCLLPFQALEFDVEPRRAPTSRSSAVARRADRMAARRAIRALCRVRPAQYLDALDLTETRWELSTASAAWRKLGLERERQLFIAWERDTPSALGVFETAGPHAHVFGLLDCVRMYPLRPGGVHAFDSLLDEAHRFFAERGRTRFVYLREFPDRLLPAGWTYRDLGGATLTLLAVERVPELIGRVCDLAVPRRQREATRAAPEFVS